MDREDAEAVPWMAKCTRNPLPKHVVWKQSSTSHARFYWLAVAADDRKVGDEVIASYAGQQVTIQTKDVSRLLVRLNDRMMDLDKPITILVGSKEVFNGSVSRTVAVLAQTLKEYGDPATVFGAEIEVRP